MDGDETTARRSWETAYHEAGHVIASLHLGIPFTAVTIEAGSGGEIGTYRGCVRHPESYTAQFAGPEEVPATVQVGDAVVALAGPLAEQDFLASCRHSYAWDTRGDYQSALSTARALRSTERGQRALFDRRMQRAGGIVGRRWAAIERLAKALMERGTLNAAEVRTILHR